jgi:hypothetical protein
LGNHQHEKRQFLLLHLCENLTTNNRQPLASSLVPSFFYPFADRVRVDPLGKEYTKKRGESPPFGGFLLTFFGWVLGLFQAELVVSADVSSIETGRLVGPAQRESSPVRGSS